jgi:hypothetical protein
MYSNSELNKLNMFKSESLQHFMAKAALFHVLRRMKHDVVTEFALPNGVGDLLDVTTSTHYELEFNFKKHHRKSKIARYKRPGFEIIVINCDKLPTEYNDLAKQLKDFIVPD